MKTKFLKGVAPPTVFTSNNMKNKTQNQRSVFGRKYSKGEFGELIFLQFMTAYLLIIGNDYFFKKKILKLTKV